MEHHFIVCAWLASSIQETQCCRSSLPNLLNLFREVRSLGVLEDVTRTTYIIQQFHLSGTGPYSAKPSSEAASCQRHILCGQLARPSLKCCWSVQARSAMGNGLSGFALKFRSKAWLEKLSSFQQNMTGKTLLLLMSVIRWSGLGPEPVKSTSETWLCLVPESESSVCGATLDSTVPGCRWLNCCRPSGPPLVPEWSSRSLGDSLEVDRAANGCSVGLFIRSSTDLPHVCFKKKTAPESWAGWLLHAVSLAKKESADWGGGGGGEATGIASESVSGVSSTIHSPTSCSCRQLDSKFPTGCCLPGM